MRINKYNNLQYPKHVHVNRSRSHIGQKNLNPKLFDPSACKNHVSIGKLEQDVARSKHVRETEFSLEKPDCAAQLSHLNVVTRTLERPGELHTRSVPPLIHGPVTGIPLSSRERAFFFCASPKKPCTKERRGGNLATDTSRGRGRRGEEKRKRRAQKRNGERGGARDATLF